MVQTLQARTVTLEDLRSHFGLQLTTSYQFFSEWMDVHLEIADPEKQRLDRVKENFLYLSQSPPMVEDAVKMVVLSPLLDLAGFYATPFRMRAEVSIDVTAQDEDVMIRGQIDGLVLLGQLWVLAIESKNMGIGLSTGIPQALSYMLADPISDRPIFGLVTTGSEFVFLKLVQKPTPMYTTSRVFSMFSPVNELYDVLRILKALGELVSKPLQ